MAIRQFRATPTKARETNTKRAMVRVAPPCRTLAKVTKIIILCDPKQCQLQLWSESLEQGQCVWTTGNVPGTAESAWGKVNVLGQKSVCLDQGL